MNILSFLTGAEVAPKAHTERVQAPTGRFNQLFQHQLGQTEALEQLEDEHEMFASFMSFINNLDSELLKSMAEKLDLSNVDFSEVELNDEDLSGLMAMFQQVFQQLKLLGINEGDQTDLQSDKKENKKANPLLQMFTADKNASEQMVHDQDVSDNAQLKPFQDIFSEVAQLMKEFDSSEHPVNEIPKEDLQKLVQKLMDLKSEVTKQISGGEGLVTSIEPTVNTEADQTKPVPLLANGFINSKVNDQENAQELLKKLDQPLIQERLKSANNEKGPETEWVSKSERINKEQIVQNGLKITNESLHVHSEIDRLLRNEQFDVENLSPNPSDVESPHTQMVQMKSSEILQASLSPIEQKITLPQDKNIGQGVIEEITNDLTEDPSSAFLENGVNQQTDQQSSDSSADESIHQQAFMMNSSEIVESEQRTFANELSKLGSEKISSEKVEQTEILHYTNPVELIDQLSGTITSHFKGVDGTEHIRIQVYPKDLGRIDLDVQYLQQKVLTDFVVSSEAIKEIIETHMPLLIDQIDQKGLNLEKMTVKTLAEKTNDDQREHKQNHSQENFQKNRQSKQPRQHKQFGYNTFEFMA